MTAHRRFERIERIRFSDCDPAGIVFYPQYFVRFNALVEDWFTEGLGIPYAELIGPRRIGLPTVSLQSEFKAISRHGDAITFGLVVERLGGASFTLALDGRCGHELRLTLRQVIVTTDLDSHAAMAIPADVRDAIERFQRGV